MSLWEAGELAYVNKMNQKTIYVGSTEPAQKFDGQVWYDTSELCLKVYSLSKTQWYRLQFWQIALDDTSVSVATTYSTQRKYFRFVKSSFMTLRMLHIELSGYVNNSAGTGYYEIYIDSESSPRLTLSTNSTTETVLSGNIDISDLTNGIHTLTLKMRSNSSSYTATNKIFQAIVWGS